MTNKPPTHSPIASTSPTPSPRRTLPPPVGPGRLVMVPVDILQRIERLVRLADRFEILLDDVMRSLEEMGWRTARVTSTDVRSKDFRRPRGTVWVDTLATDTRPDGSVTVTLDGETLVLPPHLGALLLALADDTGPGPDAGVAFKTLGDLATRVNKRLGGHALSNDTINKYVFKLRCAIARETRLPGAIIQTNRRLGRRLAIRRKPRAGLSYVAQDFSPA